MSLHSFRFVGQILIMAIIAILSGCAHKAAVEPPVGLLLDDIYTTENTNPDLDMFRKAMPEYLEQLEGLILKNPDSALRYRASGAYFGYAFCLVEDTDKEQASILYLKGRDHALSELRRYRIFDQAFGGSESQFKQSLSESFDKRNLKPLYWTAMNWLGWINLNLDKPEAQADIPKVEAMLEFINTLDESYQNGTVHAALGALYANRPKDAGGDPAKAKEQFDKAFIFTGNSLFTVHVMYAKFYAYRIQDRGLFRKTLEKVVETPANYYVEKTFVNEAARRKAKLLLDKPW